MKHNVIAIDLGASSGRIISASLEKGKMELKEQFRFSNHPVNVNGSLYWDYLKIFQEIKYGLMIAQRDLDGIDSISVDTWGVDYGFIDEKGQILLTPHSYRDTRTQEYIDDFYNRIKPNQLFKYSGVQPDVINTNLQLFSDLKNHGFLNTDIKSVMFMPNLIEYFFSGEISNEFTIASTSGLLDGQTRKLSTEIFEKLGLKKEWFGEIFKSGKVLGNILPEIAEELQMDSSVKVISGIGHDTGAAVHSLPISSNTKDNAAFISCGTWSIVGRPTQSPILSDAAYNAGLTNEGCADGSNRLLKNITGLWIVQELQKEWSCKGEVVEFGKMVDEALEAEDIESFIDPNNSMFSTPGEMEAKIIDFLKKTDQTLPKTRGELLLVVFKSLALSYQKTIADLENSTSKAIEKIYMFGGGIKNKLLVQLTANFTGKPVQIGPTEASVAGNAISQFETLGYIHSDDEKVTIVTNSFNNKIINPKDDNAEEISSWIKQYQKVLDKEVI